MSNERIDLTKELEWLHEPRGDRSVGAISKHDVVVETDYIEGLIAELKRCYERIDALEKVVADTAHCLECLSDDGCYPPCSKHIVY